MIFPCLQHLQLLRRQCFVERVDLCCLLPAARAPEQRRCVQARKNHLLSLTSSLSRTTSSEGSTYLLASVLVLHTWVMCFDFWGQPSPYSLWASLNQAPGLVSFIKELNNSH